ncbi:hypothetical protein TrLO_g4575 [Triparma laevis f. longispina]|uniref:MMS19 nucleotide excision repair protein n=2 Tax=Triparma laevis f. longispina TaxID=1714387 RepID=A0A9W7FVJ0_9STRA|nr:hypothetical protein TrLO_g4575 [Triparma laevis f. longispina]
MSTSNASDFPTLLLSTIKQYPPPIPTLTTLITSHYTPLKTSPKPELALSALLQTLGPCLTHSPSATESNDEVIASASDLNETVEISDVPPTSPYLLSASIRTTALLSFHIALKTVLPPSTLLPSSFLSLLSNFLSSRVLDPSSSSEVLNITKTFIDLSIGNLGLIKFANKILRNTNLNDLQRSIRSTGFQLLTCLASKEFKEEKGIGEEIEELVRVTCDLLLGEKDPRCLLQSLTALGLMESNLKKVTSNYPSSIVFDCVGVYYPVTFEPPPGDVIGVTNVQLRSELMNVMKGCDESWGVVVERIEEGEGEEKVKGVEDLRGLVGEGLRGEVEEFRECVLNCYDVFFRETEGLEILEDLIVTVAKIIERTDDRKWRIGFIEQTVKYLKGTVLENPESLNARSGIRLLACLARGGGTCLSIVMDGVASELIEMCGGEDVKRGKACAGGLGLIFEGGKGELIISPNPVAPYAESAYTAFLNLTTDSHVEGVISMLSLLCSPPESVISLPQVLEYTNVLISMMEEDEGDDFKRACGFCLGSVLGLKMYSSITSELLPSLIVKSLTSTYILKALCKASKESRAVTGVVGVEVVKRVCEGLREGKEGGVDALLFLVEEGGDNVINLFNETNEENEENSHLNLLEIVKSLCKINPSPEKETLRNQICLSSIPNLIKVFKTVMKPSKLLDEVEYFESVIKEDDPLNRKRLNIALPLFTASLNTLEVGEGEPILNDKLIELVKPLCKISRSLSYSLEVRTSASEGLMRIVKGTSIEAEFLKEVVVEVVLGLGEKGRGGDWVEKLGNDVRLLARIGGSAACKGGEGGVVGDEVVKTLTSLTCEGENLKSRVIGGEGLGEFMRSEGGGPFWRQRAASIALPKILENIEAGMAGEGGGEGGEVKSDHEKCFGSIIAAGHFAQSLPVKVVSKNNSRSTSLNLIQCLMAGLVLAEKRKGMGEVWEDGAWEVVVNSAMVSFQRLTREVGEDIEGVENYYGTLFPTLLHFSLRHSFSTSANILALDCLKNIAENGTFAKIKKNIILVFHRLGLVLNHPRREVRMKAVEIRNIFILLDRKN